MTNRRRIGGRSAWAFGAGLKAQLLVSLSLALSLGLGAGSQALAAEDPCLAAAKTPLETLYCTIVAGGQGAGLPSPTDFKRNDPAVQALLLRRPARRLGLEVPQPEGSQASDRTAARAPASPPTLEDPQPQAYQLADCRLQGEQIRCPQGRFELAANRPNRELAAGVLGPDNHLGLSSFRGNRRDEGMVRRYLSKAYDQYIVKMVDIGLGANTMSFTAFHHGFHTMEDAGVDFAQRMEQTFTLLKQDKQTLGVQARYHHELPPDLSQCSVINADILVCDNVGTNWVFVRPTR